MVQSELRMFTDYSAEHFGLLEERPPREQKIQGSLHTFPGLAMPVTSILVF